MSETRAVSLESRLEPLTVSARQLQLRLSRGEFSSEDLIDVYLQQIEVRQLPASSHLHRATRDLSATSKTAR